MGNSVDKASKKLLLNRLKRTESWQLVFVGLFTSLLAFFVLLISLVEIEGVRPERDYQRLIHTLTEEVLHSKESLGLSWLHVENTFSKGIKLTMSPSLFENKSLFEPARGKINPRFLPYLNRISDLLVELDLPGVPDRYRKWVSSQHRSDERFQISVRVEGHTDAHPLAPTAMYRDNIALSSVRAWAIMNYVRIRSRLPESQFVIAGYGAQEPVVNDPYSPVNRRVEIYLQPENVPVPTTSKEVR
ncbi:OmpA/MotB family protein [Hydrogenovibrio halophilus]|uniref:OmpA/MotB family protein n=1 Tax=Hydrogenovibrio halophilus TaxID=373391 RepID=UPI000368E85F|nr:OmpA family protein [Hydrogenovibrio halophilus]